MFHLENLEPRLLLSSTPDCLNIDFSTYIGGVFAETALNIEATDNCVVSVGGSLSTTFQDRLDVPYNYSEPYRSNYDAYIAKYDHNGYSQWTTFLTGSDNDHCLDVSIDSSGNIYVCGETRSYNLGGFSGHHGSADAFVAKLDGATGATTWLTYLGGSGFEAANAIALNSSGELFVAGYTTSTDFSSALSNAPDGNNGFVAKINCTDGSVAWADYFGGSGTDFIADITAVPSGFCITGSSDSTDFADNPLIGYSAAFVGSYAVGFPTYSRQWVTLFGGSDSDEGNGVAVDSGGDILVTGSTWSDDFCSGQSLNGFSGNVDAFVVKMSSSGTLKWATHIGGEDHSSWGWGDGNDQGYDIVIDEYDNAIIAGKTSSGASGTINQPRINSNHEYYYGQHSGYYEDGFVSVIDPWGDIRSFVFLGGNSQDTNTRIAISESGDLFAQGSTYSINMDEFYNDMNSVNPIHHESSSFFGRQDGYITKLDLSYQTIELGVVENGREAGVSTTDGTFSLTRSGSTAKAINIGIGLYEYTPSTHSANAAHGTDYVFRDASGQIISVTNGWFIVTIPSGSSSTTFTVDVTDDAADEYTERVVVGLQFGHSTWENDPSAVHLKIFDDEALLGDFNCDGAVNGLDIPDFKSALADPAAWDAAHPDRPSCNKIGDFDENGSFNGLDIPGFKSALAGESAMATGGNDEFASYLAGDIDAALLDFNKKLQVIEDIEGVDWLDAVVSIYDETLAEPAGAIQRD